MARSCWWVFQPERCGFAPRHRAAGRSSRRSLTGATPSTHLRVKAVDTITGVELTFIASNLRSSARTDAGGLAATDTTSAFPTDSLVAATGAQDCERQADQTARQLRGLPPGDTTSTTTDPSEHGEWFETAFIDRPLWRELVRLGDALRTKLQVRPS